MQIVLVEEVKKKENLNRKWNFMILMKSNEKERDLWEKEIKLIENN